ncbi:somatolactin alpha [Pangasianodon hypophthalmus]|uniref:somatolactin alpha n=1 Tax=Pangasianodon hypophthalmus TaxID=310915 RepID=UPI000EFE0DE9|nr:somatolactin alpha [Pangasianodon hypophthalmus]
MIGQEQRQEPKHKHITFATVVKKETFIPNSVRSREDFPMLSSETEIQQESDQWIFHSVLMLVQSRNEPLVYLQSTLDQYNDAPEALFNCIPEKLLILEERVVVLISRVKCWMREFTCFKKDAHKVETFLKLLK